MKWVLILVIRLYWLVPVRWRRSCLFKESCSHFVYRVACNEGGWAGIRALRSRIRQCRPGYAHFHTPDGQGWVILADKSVVSADECIADEAITGQASL